MPTDPPKVTLLITAEELDRRELDIEGDAYRHLLRARRLPVGAEVRVVDGAGRARWGVLVRATSRRATIELGAAAATRESEHSLELLVAALRPERASWIVEKATEIGVSAIRFFSCERTPRHYGAGHLDRWRRVARAAVEQCHRARLPEVSGVHPWTDLPRLVAASEQRFYLDLEAAPARLATSPGARLSVAVGPEGGFTAPERHELRALGCVPLCLGPRVLRVETAALVAAAHLLPPPIAAT